MTITIVKTLPKVKGQYKQSLIRCSCGKEWVVRHCNALRIKSCGCKRTSGLNAKVIHGLRNTRSYRVCRQALSRCNNPKTHGYKDYGGRGIKVCEQWQDIATFIRDMEEEIGPPPKGMFIDRKNNERGYEPGNIKWSTRTEQNRNRRSVINLTIEGETKCVAEWAEITGICKATILYRYHKQGLRGLDLFTRQRKRR